MLFTRRHEQDLVEIKVLADELARRARQAVDQLERINKGQDEALRRAGHRPPPPLARPANGDEPVVAFVHIPKTAGGTVTAMFAAAYSNRGLSKTGNFVRGPEKSERKVKRAETGWQKWRRKGGRVAVGHTPYGVMREHLPPDTRYMTFLREPVDRVISHYYRHIHRRDPSRAGSPKELALGRDKANSIQEALVEMRLPQINNLATRFLCGHPSPMGELPASALDDAKANLREFAFVGIQERFEESIVLMQRTLGMELSREDYEDRHVSPDRPTLQETPEEERALIAECNRLDVELYEFGVGLFEEAVAASDVVSSRDVETLKAIT